MQQILNNYRADLFAGRTVWVSGGTSGIGLDIALGFAGLGANVIASGSSAAKVAQLRDAHGGLNFATLDVTNAAAITRFASDLPRLDVLVNAAGISRPGQEYDDEMFLRVLDTNLISVMRQSMAVLPQLQHSQGSIINIASMLSYLADAEVPSYCASKSGVLGLTRALAHRFGERGVRVNAIAPGYHRTAMTEGLWADPQAEQKIAGRTALKRWGEAADPVGAALFLASSAAAYITGTTLAVDGGYVSG
jgi:NAD(P)-dependent dehydrogenase (short-subunit alcohol dehydrogenase family)